MEFPPLCSSVCVHFCVLSGMANKACYYSPSLLCATLSNKIWLLTWLLSQSILSTVNIFETTELGHLSAIPLPFCPQRIYE